MQNIIITGGAGFIGSHVVRLFVNKYPQYNIYNVDKLTYAGNLANLKDIEKKPNYHFIKADICDFEKMLDKYVETNYIKDWKNYSSGDKINYFIQFETGKMKHELGDEGIDTRLPNKFKLIKKVPVDQLWCIDENKKVKHFLTPNDLIKYFVDFRLKKYEDRKTLLIDVLTKRYNDNSNLCKFIKLIIAD